ncbi:hypothetical protein [Brevibacillus reuszeri]|uniref:hypothetical protein n=1 Tax=Brevibacillus reuszeri TaxID=54915 RepID=UPI00289FF416|nr:hypothetical protein [Brevibacillus reuszeri]
MDKAVWQIAIVFAGSALGGTYLGGYEWLRFFTYFGSWGTLGIVLVSLGMGWFGYSLLTLCHRIGARSVHDLYLYLFGEALASSLSVVTHFLLIAYVGVMISQLASNLIADLSPLWFILFAITISIVFIMRGWKWIVSGLALSLAVGFLFFGLVFIEQFHVPIPSLGYQMNLNWLVHSLFYFGLHTLLCVVVTIPLAARADGEQTILMGVGISTGFFFLITLLGQAILLAYWHDIHAAALPTKQILLQLIPMGDWLLALLSLIHGGLMIAILCFALATPVAQRYDLQLAPLIMVILATLLFVALIPLAIPWSISAIASAATYCGLLVLGRYIWKKQN